METGIIKHITLVLVVMVSEHGESLVASAALSASFGSYKKA